MTAYFERDVAPKVYVSDSGLACFMVGIDNFRME